VSPLASYVNRAATDAGKVADIAASRNEKNTCLCLLHIYFNLLQLKMLERLAVRLLTLFF